MDVLSEMLLTVVWKIQHMKNCNFLLPYALNHFNGFNGFADVSKLLKVPEKIFLETFQKSEVARLLAFIYCTE